MSRRGDEVMHVLANAAGVVPRHDRLDRVAPLCSRFEYGAVAVALDIVVAVIIGLPDLDLCIGNNFTASVVHPTGDGQRHAGIAGGAHHGSVRSFAFVEWA